MESNTCSSELLILACEPTFSLSHTHTHRAQSRMPAGLFQVRWRVSPYTMQPNKWASVTHKKCTHMQCGGPLHDGPVSPQYCFPLQGCYGNNHKLSPLPVSKPNSTLTSNNLLTIQVQSSVGLRENQREQRENLWPFPLHWFHFGVTSTAVNVVHKDRNPL